MTFRLPREDGRGAVAIGCQRGAFGAEPAVVSSSQAIGDAPLQAFAERGVSSGGRDAAVILLAFGLHAGHTSDSPGMAQIHRVGGRASDIGYNLPSKRFPDDRSLDAYRLFR